MLNYEICKKILDLINEGQARAVSIDYNRFRILDAQGVDITPFISVLTRTDFKENLQKTKFKALNMKLDSFISHEGSGYDKIGHHLSYIARKICTLGEFKEYPLKEHLKRGCDAFYYLLSRKD